MFTPIGSLLNTFPRRSKIPEAIMAIYVRRAFEQALIETCKDLPENILKRIKASNFKNKTLVVELPQLVSAELQMRSGGLIRAINGILGRKLVYRLRFRTG